MSRNQRLGVLALAVAVAVVAFLVARPGESDDESAEGTGAPAQTETRTETEPAPPPEPEVERIAIRGGAVRGGQRTIAAKKGESVRIVVSSDAADEIHLHGYDITRNAGPGKPARFRFEARIEGEFEIESHTAEHAGKEPLVARLVVEPG